MEDWNALRRNFQAQSFRFDPPIWARVNKLLIAKNPGYREVLKEVSCRVSSKILAEEDIEQHLADNLGILRRHGYDLELWQDPKTGKSGRQYVCEGHGGRIDLLCVDRKKRSFVVIKIKNVRAGSMTFAQIHSYMGHVAERIARRQSVAGLVISRGCDTRFKADIDLQRGSKYPIEQIDLTDFDLE